MPGEDLPTHLTDSPSVALDISNGVGQVILLDLAYRLFVGLQLADVVPPVHEQVPVVGARVPRINATALGSLSTGLPSLCICYSGYAKPDISRIN